MNQSIRLLIADEVQREPSSLRTLLTCTDDMEVVSEAGNADATLAKAHIHQPDVLLFNPCLAKQNVVQVLQAIHTRAPNTRILVLAEDWAGCLCGATPICGAAGYILKSSPIAEVRLAIHIIHHGGNVVPFVLIRSHLNDLSQRPSWFAPIAQWFTIWRSAARLH